MAKSKSKSKKKRVASGSKKPERKRVQLAIIELYDDGSINCQTDPPLVGFALIGLLTFVKRQLGG